MARFGEAVPWVFHLMAHIYASIVHALCINTIFLPREDKFLQAATNKIKRLCLLPLVEQDVSHLDVYIRNAVKKKFDSSDRYPINPTLTEESNYSEFGYPLPLASIENCTSIV